MWNRGRAKSRDVGYRLHSSHTLPIHFSLGSGRTLYHVSIYNYCLAHSGSLPHVRHSPGFKIPFSLGMEGTEKEGREGGGGERETVYTYYINSVFIFPSSVL